MREPGETDLALRLALATAILPPMSEHDSKRTLSCPDDGTALVEVERNGVMIDACPRCRGVWLERGELDKLIELEAAYEADVDEDFLAEMQGGKREERHDKHGHGGEYQKKKKKPGSFLSDFLEF